MLWKLEVQDAAFQAACWQYCWVCQSLWDAVPQIAMSLCWGHEEVVLACCRTHCCGLNTGAVELLRSCPSVLAPQAELLLELVFTLAQDEWPQV